MNKKLGLLFLGVIANNSYAMFRISPIERLMSKFGKNASNNSIRNTHSKLKKYNKDLAELNKEIAETKKEFRRDAFKENGTAWTEKKIRYFLKQKNELPWQHAEWEQTQIRAVSPEGTLIATTSFYTSSDYNVDIKIKKSNDELLATISTPFNRIDSIQFIKDGLLVTGMTVSKNENGECREYINAQILKLPVDINQVPVEEIDLREPRITMHHLKIAGAATVTLSYVSLMLKMLS